MTCGVFEETISFVRDLTKLIGEPVDVIDHGAPDEGDPGIILACRTYLFRGRYTIVVVNTGFKELVIWWSSDVEKPDICIASSIADYPEPARSMIARRVRFVAAVLRERHREVSSILAKAAELSKLI